jgi:hypothetical protein
VNADAARLRAFVERVRESDPAELYMQQLKE